MRSQFQRLDLNLLKVLMVLIDVQNTRKASEILFTSQPSISRSLQKLRDHFDDELFIRTQHGLEPTAKLLEIKQTLLPVLEQLQLTLEPKPSFDLSNFNGVVNIAVNGFIANSIAAPLTQLLLKQAPNITINIINWEQQTLDLLISGEIDIGINYYPLELSKQIYQKKMAQDGFALVCRATHPLANQSLQAHHPHTLELVSLIVNEWNEKAALAPQVLAGIGIKTNVKIRSTYLHSLLSIVKESDMLFPCSRLLANSLPEEFASIKCPKNLNLPISEVGISIGRKHRNQPKIRWLEQCIQSLFNH